MNNSLLEKYKINIDTYKNTMIKDSDLSLKTKKMLVNNNILTIADLLWRNPNTYKDFLGYNKASVLELDEFLLELETDIINELDNFPILEEWNMFLDAINELMSLEPLTCAMCRELPSAFSINLADNRYVNVCCVCADKIRNQVYEFLDDTHLW